MQRLWERKIIILFCLDHQFWLKPQSKTKIVLPSKHVKSGALLARQQNAIQNGVLLAGQ